MKSAKLGYLILISTIFLSISNVVRADGDTLSVVRAWYGVEGETNFNTSEQIHRVLAKVQPSVVNNTLNIPADMNNYFGFDPNFGKVKQVSVTINYRGWLFEIRQTEGRALIYPGMENTDYVVVYRQSLNPPTRVDNTGRSDGLPRAQPPASVNPPTTGSGRAAR